MREDGVERVAAGAGDGQRGGDARQRQDEFDAVRREESSGEVHDEEGAKHDDGESCTGEARQQARD